MFDYTARIKRYQDSLVSAELSCGFIIKAANVRYLTGFWDMRRGLNILSRADSSVPLRFANTTATVSAYNETTHSWGSGSRRHLHTDMLNKFG